MTNKTDEVPGFIYEVVDSAIAYDLIYCYQLEVRNHPAGIEEPILNYDLNVPNRKAMAWLIQDDRESAAHSIALALSMACLEPGMLDVPRPPVWVAASWVRHSLTAKEAGMGLRESGEFIGAVLDALSRYHGGREVISAEKRRVVME